MGGVNFTPGAAQKIQRAVKQVLGEPDGRPADVVPYHNSQNRLFWARADDAAQYFVEVYQTSSGGTLSWQDVPGGRNGSLSNFLPGFTGSAASDISPAFYAAAGVFLVFQWFDAGTSPPTPYYAALGDDAALVTVTSNATAKGTYNGELFTVAGAWDAFANPPTTNYTSFAGGLACFIINLEEMGNTLGNPGNGSGWILATEDHWCLGTIVGTTAAGVPVVVINNGNVGAGSGGALGPGDYWNIQTGWNSSGGTTNGFTVSLVSSVVVTDGEVTAVYYRDFRVDARGRIMGVTDQGGS